MNSIISIISSNIHMHAGVDILNKEKVSLEKQVRILTDMGLAEDIEVRRRQRQIAELQKDIDILKTHKPS